ncbi:hypothetical protein [Nocardiopsis alba]|uniref:hypothetical protein n=1 Tax=Nocardiopsis alba TaxID=53437 RepID=UPI0035E0DA63
MGNGLRAKRLGTLAVLLGMFVLMSLACSFATAPTDGPDRAAVPATAQVAAADEGGTDLAASASTEDRTSHPCGPPQIQPSISWNLPLLPFPALALFDLFEAPHETSSPRTGAGEPSLHRADGLLTFLCVQRV